MDQELTTSHRIYYSNKDNVPLGDVAESLLAIQNIINQSPAILEALLPGVKIISVNVFINELQAGSLWEDIVVKFMFGSQKKFDAFISSSREMLGMDYLQSKPQLFSVIILALILSGGLYAVHKGINAKPDDVNAIENNNNIIINIGAELTDMSPEQFKKTIETNIKDKAKLSKQVVHVIKPAKKDKTASITFDDNSKLSVSPEVIQAVPSHLMDDEPDDLIEDYNSVELIIRAIDLDSKKRGWAVLIPSISNNRIKLQLDPSINPELLMAKRRFIGNVSVVFKHDENGSKYPSLIFLRSIED